MSDGPTICTTCDNPVVVHEGPVAPWRVYYLLVEVATALVQLGLAPLTRRWPSVPGTTWNGVREYRRGPATV